MTCRNPKCTSRIRSGNVTGLCWRHKNWTGPESKKRPASLPKEPEWRKIAAQ